METSESLCNLLSAKWGELLLDGINAIVGIATGIVGIVGAIAGVNFLRPSPLRIAVESGFHNVECTFSNTSEAPLTITEIGFATDSSERWIEPVFDDAYDYVLPPGEILRVQASLKDALEARKNEMDFDRQRPDYFLAMQKAARIRKCRVWAKCTTSSKKSWSRWYDTGYFRSYARDVLAKEETRLARAAERKVRKSRAL